MHEHAAHEELRVVVVAFHEAVAGIAVPGSATVGHQRGRHLVLIAGEDHVGQAFVEVLVGQEILDLVVIVVEVRGVHHLGLEALLALPLDERGEDVVVHGVGDHDHLAVLFDVVVAVLKSAGIEEALCHVSRRSGRHAYGGHCGVDGGGFGFGDAHGNRLVCAEHARYRVVLKRVAPHDLTAQSALDKRGAQHRGLGGIERVDSIGCALDKRHGRRVHIAEDVAFVRRHLHAAEVGVLHVYHLQRCAHLGADEQGGVHLAEVGVSLTQERRIAQNAGDDGRAVGRFDLLKHGVGKIKSDHHAVVVVSNQGGVLCRAGRTHEYAECQGDVPEVHAFGHGFSLQVIP